MCNNERKPHVHCEAIKAWADGAEIEYRARDNELWEYKETPQWIPSYQYRIKPKPNDLQRYGIEIGDVWLVNGSTITIKKLKGDWVDTTGYLQPSVNELDTLIFRRGVINKL